MATIRCSSIHSLLFVVAVVTGIGSTQASVQFLGTGTGSSTNNLAASADFSVVGGNLKVTLTNTASSAIAEPQDVLMGLLFKIVGVTDLTPAASNAATASGLLEFPTDSIQNPATAGPGYLDVSGEWAYIESASSGVGSFGLGAAGRGLWGEPDVMVGADRGGGGAPPDGADFGIVSTATGTSSGNGGFQNNGPYVRNSVTFNLGAVPSGFVPSATLITNVVFLYGTDSSNPSFTGLPPTDPHGEVPEPMSLLVWCMLGLVGSFGRSGCARLTARTPVGSR